MPELVYNVKFQIDDGDFGQGAAGVSAYKEKVEELKNEIDQLNKRQKNLGNSAREMNKQLGQTNKQVALGNQLFFSLSDGIQDSTQFAYGFGTGMRAVGNNIGFTAELAGNFIQRTKEMNNGVLNFSGILKGLSASFLGVGGVIFALNTAITLITMFSLRQKEASQSTTDFARETNSLVSALQALGMFRGDFLGIERTSIALEDINKRIADARENQFTDADQARLNDAIREQSSILKFISVDGERVLNQRYEELQATIDNLTARKEASVTEERLAGLIEEQKRLADELELAIGSANSERVKALQLEMDIAKEQERQIELQLKMFEERERMYYMEQGLIEASEEARKRNEEDAQRREQERLELLMNPPDTSKVRENESRVLRESMRLEQDLLNLRRDAISTTIQAGLAQFMNNKQIAIATALIDTYVAAQKAYASQLVIGDPTSIARAQQAAIFSVAQGLARIAIMRGVQPDGSGGGGSAGASAGGRFGFQSTNVEGPQTFRTPSFTPSGQDSQPKIFIANKVVADRKQLYVLNKLGEEEYRQIKV